MFVNCLIQIEFKTRGSKVIDISVSDLAHLQRNPKRQFKAKQKLNAKKRTRLI